MMNISDYTQNYLKPGFESKQVYYRRKLVLETISRYNPQVILEIGCGMEPLYSFLEYIPRKYVIVEPSDVFAENAVRLKTGIEGKLECAFDEFQVIHEAFNPDKKYKEYNFDFIICSSLLHLVDEPDALMRAIHMACGDNTMIHVNVPNANSFHRVLAFKAGLIKSFDEFSERDKKLQHHRVYNIEQLTELVDNNGFEIVEKGSYFVKPFTHNQMQRLLDENIIDDRVLDGFYYMTDCLPNMGSEIYANCRAK